MDDEKRRLDKWLWYARFFKTRSLASAAVRAGKVRVNDLAVHKAGATVRIGDEVRFHHGGRLRVVGVCALGVRRGPAPEAQALYEDRSPAIEAANDTHLPVAGRARGAGRPTKAERRALDRWRRDGES